MGKFLSASWSVILYVWKYIKPVWTDIRVAIAMAKAKGLKDEPARKEVFQYVTDCIQRRGLSKIPDSVLNTAIELGYQIYIWKRS